VHLLDYSGGELYGQELSVDLLSRVRNTMAFPDPHVLQQQIARDLQTIRELAAAYAAAVDSRGP
jgi:FAD synthase